MEKKQLSRLMIFFFCVIGIGCLVLALCGKLPETYTVRYDVGVQTAKDANDANDAETKDTVTATPTPVVEAAEVAEEPAVTEAAEATEEPAVTEAAEATEEPAVTEEAEATEELAVTEAPEVTETPEPTTTPPAGDLLVFVLTNVEKDVNVRAGASTETDKVGSLKKGATGVVLEEGEEFSKVQTDEITGYVSNKYLLIGDEAEKQLEKIANTKVVINSSCNVRSGPGMNYGKIGTVHGGEEYKFDANAPSVKGWYAIILEDGRTGYVGYLFSKVVEP